MHTTELSGIIAEHVAAVNAFDIDAVVATFAPDAYVNDARREIKRHRCDPRLGGQGDGWRPRHHGRA